MPEFAYQDLSGKVVPTKDNDDIKGEVGKKEEKKERKVEKKKEEILIKIEEEQFKHIDEESRISEFI
jgi:hypothetical protein